MKTRITNLLDIQLPIIQGGMVWVSGADLAIAVSECGALGVIGAGSMKTDVLEQQIWKIKKRTTRPFGVNIPLTREDRKELLEVALATGVRIFLLSSGDPSIFTRYLKQRGCIVIHVVASPRHAQKAETVGCDAVVAEGFEAGGHNGVDELTTFSLVPLVKSKVNIPLIAAGGITTGSQMLAAFSLGAEAVQIGTRFAVTKESAAHQNYKQAVIEADATSTILSLKKVTPIRAIKNPFLISADFQEKEGATQAQMIEILGKKRERLGIFEGDTTEGLLEAGQGVGLINDIPTVKELIERLMYELEQQMQYIHSLTQKDT